MKILYLLRDGRSELADKIIEEQSMEHEVRVIDLSLKEPVYEDIADAIFSHDKVISW